MPKGYTFSDIRRAYEEKMPLIIKYGGQTDPYFMQWEFTPIEWHAWQCIRMDGLPMFPQVPVGRRFIDFGDPIKKIGIEVDGKDWHDEQKDRARDAELKDHGWIIFRIKGSEIVKRDIEYDIDELTQRYDGPEAYEKVGEFIRNSLRNNGQAVIKAIGHCYYDHDNYISQFAGLGEIDKCLAAHTYHSEMIEYLDPPRKLKELAD